MDAGQKKVFVQILGQLLIADGMLKDAERDFLERVMDQLALSGGERKAAISGISVDSPVEDRFRSLPPDAQQQLLQTAEAAAQSDNEMTPGEANMLARLRELAG